MPCGFAQSMTFLHMVICLGTTSRDIKRVQYMKTIYLGHRKFLRPNHTYHRLQKAFNGKQEFGIAPKPLIEKEFYKIQQHINVVFGKKRKGPVEIFFGKRDWCSLIFHISLTLM